jgi:hypothetical protein
VVLTGLTDVGQLTRGLVFRCILGSEGCVLVPRSSGTPVATWAWTTWVVSRRRVLEVVFVLLESPSPSKRIFISSHSLPPLWFAVSVLHKVKRGDRNIGRQRGCRTGDLFLYYIKITKGGVHSFVLVQIF